MKKSIYLLGIVALMAGGAHAALITATTTDYVRGGTRGAQDQDASEEILFKSTANANTSRSAFLRFALTNEQKAEMLAATSSVTLDMYFIFGNSVTGNDTTLKVYGLADGADAGAGTSETTWGTDLTWNTRPDGDTVLNNALTTFIGDTFVPSTNSVETVLSLTLGKTELDALITADTNNEITFVLGDTAASGSMRFASLTNTGGYAAPTLNVVPEPATLGMIVSAGASLLFVRRRFMM